ncbi:MAG: minor capsid protein [Lactovum sp.]
MYDEYKFVALIDSWTSSICRSLEGKAFKMSEKETDINFPPMYPSCRSHLR